MEMDVETNAVQVPFTQMQHENDLNNDQHDVQVQQMQRRQWLVTTFFGLLPIKHKKKTLDATYRTRQTSSKSVTAPDK